jgi:hypothetical protein
MMLDTPDDPLPLDMMVLVLIHPVAPELLVMVKTCPTCAPPEFICIPAIEVVPKTVRPTAFWTGLAAFTMRLPSFVWVELPTFIGAEIFPFGGESVGPVHAFTYPAVRTRIRANTATFAFSMIFFIYFISLYCTTGVFLVQLRASYNK